MEGGWRGGGRMEGWRERRREDGGVEGREEVGWREGRREGRGDGDGEQTDAAQTPEGLRSHIFLASSPGGQRYVRAPACTPTDAHGTHARTGARTHTQASTHRAE